MEAPTEGRKPRTAEQPIHNEGLGIGGSQGVRGVVSRMGGGRKYACDTMRRIWNDTWAVHSRRLERAGGNGLIRRIRQVVNGAWVDEAFPEYVVSFLTAVSAPAYVVMSEPLVR